MTSATAAAGRAGPWSSLAVLLTGNFITILDVFIVYVALPDIQRDLHSTDAELQLTIVAYSVPYGAMLLNGARLGDLYGRRRLFLVGMAVFAIGSLLCALSPSPLALVGSRAIQGVGAALLMPQVYTSLRLLFEGGDRRRALSIMGAVQGVAGAASQVIGGYLIALNIGEFGWRLVFLVNIPVAIYALVAGRWLIVETRAAVSAKLDLPGAILGASAIALILFPLMFGREAHWAWWTIGGPLLSVPVLLYFIWYESSVTRRGRVPIINISLFKNVRFNLGTLIACLFFSAVGSFSLALMILLQVGLGRSALEAGSIFLPSTVAFFLGSIVSAPLAKRLKQGARLVGMLIFAVGLLIAVATGFAAKADGVELSASLILQGFGQGIVIPLLLDMILGVVSDEEAGMASGAFSTMQIVGSATGVTIVGIILFTKLGLSSQTGGPNGYNAYADAFATSSLYNLFAVSLSVGLLVCLQRLGR